MIYSTPQCHHLELPSPCQHCCSCAILQTSSHLMLPYQHIFLLHTCQNYGPPCSMPKQIEMISYLKLFATVSPKHTVSESFFFCHSSIRNIQSLFHLTICLLQDHNLPSHCLEAKSALSRTVIFLLWFHDG